MPPVSPHIRKVFTGPLVLNQEYDHERAGTDLDSGVADAISFGRPYLANPDLVERLRRGAAQNPIDPATLYSQGAAGYTDYPVLETEPA